MTAMLHYADEYVSLYQGDCLTLDAWATADVLLTDPPYGMSYASGWHARPIEGDADTRTRDRALVRWREPPHMPDRPALVFGRWDILRPSHTRLVLTWDKGDWPGMGDLNLPWGPSTEEIYVLGKGFVTDDKRRGTVIRTDRMVGDLAHPNEKPVALMERLLAFFPADAVVADPFAGSGAVLRACKNLGRRAVGCEIDGEYARLAAKRLAQEVLDFGGVA